MCLNSGDDAASFLELVRIISLATFLFGFDPPAPVSWMSTHLRKSDFLNLSGVAPVAWMLVRLLFFHRYSPD